MRTQIDRADEQSPTVKAGREKVPGGKVLQRLGLFNDQRGFEVAPSQIESPPESASRSSKKKTKKKTAKSKIQTCFEAKSIAQLYIDACEVQSADMMVETTAPPPSGLHPLGWVGPPRWRPVGPVRVPGGQTYGSGRVDVSGRVSSVAIDPSNPNHILCGSAAGGVWESTNGGSNWQPRTDQMPTLTTGAIAFDPSSPNLVYAGTGEGDFYAGLGAGLLRSTNGGTTWVVHTDTPFVGVGFHDIEIDAANGDRMLAGTTNGLFRSTDGGTNWNRRRNSRTWSLSMDSAGGNNAEILAACSDGLFRSINGGQTWTAVNLPSAPAAWTRLAVSHVRSNVNVAYAFGVSGGSGFLYRRNNAGNWQQITTPGGLRVGQGWYDWFVAAAPDNDDQVYLGAINAHRGDRSGTTWTWTNLSAKTSGDSIHPDQHAITFHPTNADIVYIGNDGGLYRSNDRGISWQSLNNGLTITEFEYIAQDLGSSKWLMGGTQDNGTNRYRGSLVWDHIADGDGGDCGVNNSTPDTIFHSFFNMGVRRSTDRGENWSWIPTSSRDSNIYRQLFYPPMEVMDNTVAQAGESVFISRDSGNNWTEIGLPNRPIASAMHMPTADRLIVGTTGGQIYQLNWSGTAWTGPDQLTSPRNSWISDVTVDPRNANRLWATSSTIGGGRVFVSEDGGTNWTDRTAGLPALPINSVTTDPRNSNRAWVAADVGVFQTRDRGATWTNMSLGLPNVLVADLVYHKHARVLRAGTRNRGVWEIPVDGWLGQPICGRQFTETVGPNQRRRWFTFRWPATWHVVWTVMPTTVHRGAPQLSWNAQVERADAEYVTYWISVRNHTSRSVSFEGRYCILSFY